MAEEDDLSEIVKSAVDELDGHIEEMFDVAKFQESDQQPDAEEVTNNFDCNGKQNDSAILSKYPTRSKAGERVEL